MSSRFERDQESLAEPETPEEFQLLGDLHKAGIHHGKFYDHPRTSTGQRYPPRTDREGRSYPRDIKITVD